MIAIRLLMISALLLTSGLLSAAVKNVSNQVEHDVQVIMTSDKGTELQLEARQAPLALVLNEIASKTGVRINYSVLPGGLVTATCVGTTVKEVLECLLNRKSDLVFRYHGASSQKNPEGQPAEAWVLGAKYIDGQTPNTALCIAADAQQQTLLRAAKKQTEAEQAEPDMTEELVKMAKSTSTEERVSAIGQLLAGGRAGDAGVRETLEAALTDKDPRVRAQAISSYANREGEGAYPALQEALHDSDASVRQMAVSAANTQTLLQQAINDNVESIRLLAQKKLEALLKTDSP